MKLQVVETAEKFTLPNRCRITYTGTAEDSLMSANAEQIRFLWDLLEEASERRDALTERTDFRRDRIDWDASVRPRLEQEFGNGEVAGGFNNPDKGGSLANNPDPSTALEAAKALYDADIKYFQDI